VIIDSYGARFEELNIDLFKEAIKPLGKVLEDADMTKKEVNKVVLVGGSTRIPKIRKMVEEFIGDQSKVRRHKRCAVNSAVRTRARLVNSAVRTRARLVRTVLSRMLSKSYVYSCIPHAFPWL
jgi:molecular chaperone DnaK (HSP70)